MIILKKSLNLQSCSTPRVLEETWVKAVVFRAKMRIKLCNCCRDRDQWGIIPLCHARICYARTPKMHFFPSPFSETSPTASLCLPSALPASPDLLHLPLPASRTSLPASLALSRPPPPPAFPALSHPPPLASHTSPPHCRDKARACSARPAAPAALVQPHPAAGPGTVRTRFPVFSTPSVRCVCGGRTARGRRGR